MFVTSFCYCIM